MKRATQGTTTSPDTVRKSTNNCLTADLDPSLEAVQLKCQELEKANERLHLLAVTLNRLKAKLAEKEALIESLFADKAEWEKRQKKLEISLLEEIKKSLTLELEKTELDLAIKSHHIKQKVLNLREESDNVRIRILTSQQKAIADALEDSEKECLKLLKEKKDRTERIGIDLLNLNAVEYMNKDMLRETVINGRFCTKISLLKNGKQILNQKALSLKTTSSEPSK
jgi:hypothetical protein